MDLTPGHQLGTYRVIRLIGKGGMGAVYEVEHTQLGVRYALKTFTLEDGHVDVLKNKFLAEGKILARIHHPHIVHVFDLNFDEATSTLYFVMDLVLGRYGAPHTLADVVADSLEEERAIEWFGELAAALDYVHEQGIVHRDIKLGNVLLNADSKVVLSDFGVSHLFSERLRSDVDAVRTMVTEVGTGSRLVMGTQGYMAPEVIRGEEATPAADSYSLGVMFVYLLTGIWYEPGSRVFKLLDTLEYRWGEVLRPLLAENPADRPTNLTELAQSLRRAPVDEQEKSEAEEVNLPASPRQSSGIRPVTVILLLIAAVSVLIAVGFLLFAPGPAPFESHRPDSSAAPHANSAATDDFNDAFSARGIYKDSRK